MSVKYQYSGLTPELYQRLVSEHAELRKTHKKGSYRQFVQDVRQCSEAKAKIIYQAFNNAVVERLKLSPRTVERLEGYFRESYSAKSLITFSITTSGLKGWTMKLIA